MVGNVGLMSIFTTLPWQAVQDKDKDKKSQKKDESSNDQVDEISTPTSKYLSGLQQFSRISFFGMYEYNPVYDKYVGTCGEVGEANFQIYKNFGASLALTMSHPYLPSAMIADEFVLNKTPPPNMVVNDGTIKFQGVFDNWVVGVKGGWMRFINNPISMANENQNWHRSLDEADRDRLFKTAQGDVIPVSTDQPSWGLGAFFGCRYKYFSMQESLDFTRSARYDEQKNIINYQKTILPNLFDPKTGTYSLETANSSITENYEILWNNRFDIGKVLVWNIWFKYFHYNDPYKTYVRDPNSGDAIGTDTVSYLGSAIGANLALPIRIPKTENFLIKPLASIESEETKNNLSYLTPGYGKYYYKQLHYFYGLELTKRWGNVNDNAVSLSVGYFRDTKNLHYWDPTIPNDTINYNVAGINLDYKPNKYVSLSLSAYSNFGDDGRFWRNANITFSVTAYINEIIKDGDKINERMKKVFDGY